jgi:hypothetical protein
MVDGPTITDDCCRRGYLVHRPNIVYHYIWNEYWRFALSIDLCDGPPLDFGNAERVIHLPVVLSGPMLLHGDADWHESTFKRLSIGPGRYSVFSKGWNLGAEAQSPEAEEADDESFWGLSDVERYEWIICPMVDDLPRVLRGKEYLY